MEKKKHNGLLITLLVVLLVALGAGGMYYAMKNYGLFGTTVVNKTEKEVTVNESGIADAVEKLYDTVVVVGSYKSGVLNSSGTGFVYKVDGNTAYLLTNNHVVSGADKVKVKFTDGNVYEVKKIGVLWFTVQNWKSTTYNDGIPIPNVTSNAAWTTLTTGAMCAYNNDENNV